MSLSNNIRAFSLLAIFAIPFNTAVSGEFYLGVGAGASDFKNINCPTGIDCDTSDTGWKLFGGYQVTPNFGVEGAWVDIGETTLQGDVPGAGTLDGKGTGDGFVLAGTVGWPASDKFRLYGKLGAYFYSAQFDSTVNGVANENTDESGTELMYGLGGQFDFTKRIGARLEWERYNDIDSKAANQDPVDVDLFSVSLVILFPQ